MFKSLFLNCNIFLEQYYLKIFEFRNKNIQNNFKKIILNVLNRKVYVQLLWFLILFSNLLLNLILFHTQRRYLKYFKIKRSIKKNPVEFLYLNFIYISKPYIIFFCSTLPKLIKKMTILRSPFVYKTTREQFEIINKKTLVNVFTYFDSVWSICFFHSNHLKTQKHMQYDKKYIYIKNTFIFNKEKLKKG